MIFSLQLFKVALFIETHKNNYGKFHRSTINNQQSRYCQFHKSNENRYSSECNRNPANLRNLRITEKEHKRSSSRSYNKPISQLETPKHSGKPEASKILSKIKPLCSLILPYQGYHHLPLLKTITCLHYQKMKNLHLMFITKNLPNFQKWLQIMNG